MMSLNHSWLCKPILPNQDHLLREKKFLFATNDNKFFTDQACLVKMAACWPKTVTWPISSHLAIQLIQQETLFCISTIKSSSQ